MTSADLSSYQLKTDMSTYLKINDASNTYQRTIDMVNFLTTNNAQSLYQLKTNMNDYLLTSTASLFYVTNATATQTYQPIGSYASAYDLLNYAPLANPTFSGVLTTPDIKLSKLYTQSGLYETSNMLFSTGNGTNAWSVGSITGYILANN